MVYGGHQSPCHKSEVMQWYIARPQPLTKPGCRGGGPLLGVRGGGGGVSRGAGPRRQSSRPALRCRSHCNAKASWSGVTGGGGGRSHGLPRRDAPKEGGGRWWAMRSAEATRQPMSDNSAAGGKGSGLRSVILRRDPSSFDANPAAPRAGLGDPPPQGRSAGVGLGVGVRGRVRFGVRGHAGGTVRLHRGDDVGLAFCRVLRGSTSLRRGTASVHAAPWPSAGPHKCRCAMSCVRVRQPLMPNGLRWSP